MRRTLLLLLLLLPACRSVPPSVPPESTQEIEAMTPNLLAAELWEAELRHNPLEATFVGDRRYDHLLPDISEAAHGAWLAELQQFAKRVAAFDTNALAGEEKITAQVLREQLENRIALEACRAHTWDVDQLGGWQVTLGQLANNQAVDSPEAAQAFLSRVRKVGDLFDQHIANLRSGLAAGYSAPKVVVERVVEQLRVMVAATPESSPLMRIMERVKGLDAQQSEAFRKDLLATVQQNVRPALDGYRAFLADTYLAKARANVGISNNPEGHACYQARIRHHTGSSMSAEQIHQAGLDELKRLQSELDEIAVAAGHKDGRAFFAALSADPKQHLTTREALISHNEQLVARASAALPKAFGLLPPIPVEVKAIEKFREADSLAAFYNPAPDDRSRPALYYINTYQPETRPLYNMEALAFHEAVPGHHLQIAIAQNLDLPDVRRHIGVTAYVEGWALYSELVADELGLYSGPATRAGMLNYQMWRATRLVVDTGMHALGWTRDQAITFMMDNLSFPEHEIRNEIDRYIIWPGQALAYMLGRMEIQRMRSAAEQKLGDSFDLRGFHDAVLGHGALPLAVLGQVVDAWVAERAAGN